MSLPEELQKILDQKIGMGMVGNNMGQFMQYQTAQAIPQMAQGVGQGGGGGGLAGDAMGLGAGMAMGQMLANQIGQGLNAGAAQAAPAAAAAAPAAAAPAAIRPDEVMATIEKLADLKGKGILTEDEFNARRRNCSRSWFEVSRPLPLNLGD